MKAHCIFSKEIELTDEHSSEEIKLTGEHSSEEIELTDEHMNMLERHVPKFRATDMNSRRKMVEEAADCIQNACTEDARFNRGGLTNVCELSTKI